MCYLKHMATATQSAPSFRTVVLLRGNEKKRLQRLAKAERVSSGEIIRRSLEAYKPDRTLPARDAAEDVSNAVSEMNKALDAALDAVRSARAEVAQNIKKVHQLRAKKA